MARFYDQNKMHLSREQLFEIASQYSMIIGVLLTKTGPVQISTEDVSLYMFSKLTPVIDASQDMDGFNIRLLGEDEWPEHGADVAM